MARQGPDAAQPTISISPSRPKQGGKIMVYYSGTTPHELTIEFWPGGTSTINVPAGGVSVNVPDDAETMTITDPAPNGANGIDVVVSAS